jgi:sRNA-binding regulator protein Hfq
MRNIRRIKPTFKNKTTIDEYTGEEMTDPFERSELVRYNNQVYMILDYYRVVKCYEMINNIKVEVLDDARRNKVYCTIDLLDGTDIQANIDSILITKIDYEERKQLLFTHAVKVYNELPSVKNKVESVNDIILLFDRNQLDCHLIFDLIWRIRETEDEKYDLFNIFKNPFEFIEEDWQLFTHDEALAIQKELSISIPE